MHKVSGVQIWIHCDYKARILRVMDEIPLIPGFRSSMPKHSMYKTREEWVNSSYYRQVNDEEIVDMIEWFWMDLLTDGLSDATQPPDS